MLIGRVGADPELRQARNGSAWGSFSVATHRSRKEGDAWVEETDWHDVRVFGEDAERCHKRLKRGSVVAVEGTLVYDVWTDEQGVKRRKPRVVASRLQFLADLRPSEAVAGDRPAAEEEVREATIDLTA